PSEGAQELNLAERGQEGASCVRHRVCRVQTAPGSGVRWPGEVFRCNCRSSGNPGAGRTPAEKAGAELALCDSLAQNGRDTRSPAVISSSCAVRLFVPFDPLTIGRVCDYPYIAMLG